MATINKIRVGETTYNLGEGGGGGGCEYCESLAEFFGLPEATEYTELTSAQMIVLDRYDQTQQYPDWPIVACSAAWTTVTEAQVQAAVAGVNTLTGLNITYSEITPTHNYDGTAYTT